MGNRIVINMQIRNYIESDKAMVMSIWEKCGLLAPGSNYKRDIDRKMAFQPDLFFVGTIDGNIAGTIMVGYDGRRGWLNCLAVKPDLQKSGYGRQLVEFGISKLKDLGCAKVNIQVRQTNLGVISFYDKLGFKPDNVVSMGMKLE
jgi:ribosomal protein S18 acetylase RimI-like enzyme